MNIGNRCIRHGCRMLVQYYMMTWHQQSSHWLIKWMRQNVMWLVWSIRKGYVERFKFFFFLSSFVYFESRLQHFVYLWFSFSLFLFFSSSSSSSLPFSGCVQQQGVWNSISQQCVGWCGRSDGSSIWTESGIK